LAFRIAILSFRSGTSSKKGGASAHATGSNVAPGGLGGAVGRGCWLEGGGVVDVPLMVMVATRTIPSVFTELRLTDR
jgi:hypothetical protein